MFMADVQSLSAAQAVILATELCSKADFQSFEALQNQRPDVLGAELCCRILLTFLSGNEDPENYVLLLKQLRGNVADSSTRNIDISGVDELSEADARRTIKQIRLERLKPIDSENPDIHDVVARFVIQQACRIDAETGDLPAILHLVEPFIDGVEPLRRWLISNLLPLLRLDYEYYSDGASGLSLAAIKNLAGSNGLDMLLHRTKAGEGRPFVGRDLRGIVGPWMYGTRSSKRRKLSPTFRRASITAQHGNFAIEESAWQDVNEWILKTSIVDYDMGTRAISEWNGPGDVDLGGYEDPSEPIAEDDTNLSTRYGQAALAAIYATNETSVEAMQNSWRILERVADIADVSCHRQSDHRNALPNYSAQPERITGLSPSDLRLDTLLEPHHGLTWPSTEPLNFLWAILTSIRILKDDLRFQQELSCRNATSLCLFSAEQAQRQELHKVMQHFARVASAETDWYSIRERILWLCRWGGEVGSPDEEKCRGLFWRISNEDVETEILSAMLTAKQYQTAITLYLAAAESSPLPFFLTEKIVEHEILNTYDNASNGNRSRGGLKRASEILKAFGPHFPPSSPVNKIEHLLAATHSLSFYQLTLQHGVPFQPVTIRVHQDPVSLISKVLEQNSKAYTKLDDLLSIGRGFAAAGLPISSEDEESTTSNPEDNLENKMLESDHRITYDAIISALSSNDFDTAYSYILTRLFPSPQLSSSSAPVDDTSWRAAYAAGRHRLPISASPSEKITNLSKRMELLSLALTLVPDSSPLPSMLATWQSCEEELNNLRAREAAEEKAWDDRGDNLTSSVPGGFGLEDRDVDIAETRRERERRRVTKMGRRRMDEDEAPMGLFDVARGAARAIGKSAFPLRSPYSAQGMQVVERPGSFGDPSRSSDEYGRGATGSGDEGYQNRVRKRDMVSNMVTGGLVSGLGWVLGAQPVSKDGVGHGSDGQHGQSRSE
jgi:protein transport protein SEC39